MLFRSLKAGFIKNAKIGALVGGVVLAELIALFSSRALSFASGKAAVAATVPKGVSNTAALGQIIYTKYAYFFQSAGMILLTAMIGAIVLTLRHREGVKRQSISAQVARSPKTALEVVKVPSGGYNIPPALKKEAAE